ncbi:MAG: MFS transporter [Anaerolineales bacterium]|nr:MFS transporter [Anaerolineales bacterium]
MNSSLILVSLSLFAWGIGEGMFLYFVPLYLEQLGANPITIGSVFGAFGFAMMVAHIPAGYLSDRIGRRPMIRAAWVIGLVAAWVMGLAPSLPFFIAGYVLYGVTGFVSSPLFSYVTAARGKLTAGRAMTLTSAMYNLGAVLGPVSGGWIGEQFDLRTIFLVSAAIFVASTGLVFSLKPQPRDVHEGDGSGRNLLANTRFLSFLGVSFFVMFAMYLPQPLSPNFLQNERGIALNQMGLIGSLGSLGNVAFNLILGQLNTRLGFVLGQVCVALFALALWKGTGQAWYMLGYFLLGGFRAARMLAMAQVRVLIHQAQMGLAYGITEAGNSAALILAPLLAGYLYDKDPASIYPLSLLLVAIGVIISVIFTPREKRRAIEEII